MTANPKVVAVIQARMNSTRLPGKIMLPLAGAPMLQRLVERVRGASLLDGLVIATTNTPADDPVESLCRDLNVACYRGSESDVLGRMLAAAEAQGADVMVRLTADNPFVDGSLVDLVTGAFLSDPEGADYAHNADGCGFPFGLYVEVCRLDRLKAFGNSTDPADHEHVTWPIRRRAEVYRHVAVSAPGPFADDHLSIDSREDYKRLKPLFEALHARNPDFGYLDLMKAAMTT